MQNERSCTTADLLELGLRWGWAGLQVGFDTGRVQWTTPRPPARSDGATRRVLWMTPRPPGWP